jgi:hypothetical protein
MIAYTAIAIVVSIATISRDVPIINEEEYEKMYEIGIKEVVNIRLRWYLVPLQVGFILIAVFALLVAVISVCKTEKG